MTKVQVDEVVIDGMTYVPKTEAAFKGNVRIVVLQRGWILVGEFERNGSDCKLHRSSVIRSWGTTNGLGEIAKNGPTSSTKLDKNYGTVEFDYLTVVQVITCNDEKWKSCL